MDRQATGSSVARSCTIYKGRARGELSPQCGAANSVAQGELFEPRCKKRALLRPTALARLVGGPHRNVKQLCGAEAVRDGKATARRRRATDAMAACRGLGRLRSAQCRRTVKERGWAAEHQALQMERAHFTDNANADRCSTNAVPMRCRYSSQCEPRATNPEQHFERPPNPPSRRSTPGQLWGNIWRTSELAGDNISGTRCEQLLADPTVNLQSRAPGDNHT